MSKTAAEVTAWLRTNRRRVVLVEVAVRVSGVETTKYLSNTPFVTTAAETPSAIAYSPCITGGVAFSETLSLSGAASVSYGNIQLDNAGGVRDDWLASTHVWANRSIKVYIGDAQWVRDDFYKVFDGLVADIDSSDAENLELKLVDKLQRLNNPISETLLGGSTNNKDRLIPICFGEVFNVEPLLTNPATLEYQVHNGPIESIIEVRSNGAVPVSNTVFVSTGKFTLSTSPDGVNITCSVQGSKPVSYSNNIATIVQDIVQNYGPTYTRLVVGDLDSASLTAFTAAFPQPVGMYCTERINMLEACQQLAGSVGAQVVMTTQGKLRLVQLTNTPAGTPVDLTAADIDYHTLAVGERPPVKAAVKLGFCKNYTVQETIAGGVVASSAALFKKEWLTVTSSDSTVAGVYKLQGETVMEETQLLVEADATTEADRRRDMWKTPRTLYSARGRAHLLLTELGDPVTLTHTRFGLAGGVLGQVVGIERDWLAGRITLRVFT
jgi:hypothetical protein